MLRITALLSLSLVAAACASGPAAVDPIASRAEARAGYAGEGTHPVGVIPIGAVRDDQRGTTVEVSVEYPTTAALHPVIIFSHGRGVTNRDYIGLSAFWASHGYVVIKPNHRDTAQEGAAAVDERRNRVRDITAIIDALPRIHETFPELEGRVDVNRVGVGGHSYGAYAALLVGGAEAFVEGGASRRAGDSRVKATVAMSPAGTNETLGLRRESFTGLTGPVLYVTGSYDLGAQGQPAEWRREPFDFGPAGDKWFVSIIGARHSTFTGRFVPPKAGDERDPRMYDPRYDPRSPQYDPRLAQSGQPATRADIAFERERQLFALGRAISLAFWDAYLKNEAKGREYLGRLSQRGDLTVATK